MDLPNLVFNVHIYCGARSPVTGNPTNVAACAQQDGAFAGQTGRGPPGRWPRRDQPGARPGSSPSSARRAARRSSRPSRLTLDAEQVGWAYWSWKYYGDPTGSAPSRS